MANLIETCACVPTTERGRGILISGYHKSNSILYCNGRSVFIRYLDRPLDVAVYGDHSYPVPVARYSPNGEWIASADVSGTVRIWGTHNDFVLKNEFKVLSGRIDDLQWSPDGLRIVASGDGKGKSFVRAFMWDSGTTVGEFDGHSKRVLSCHFKPTRPFRIATCGEDFLVNFYEGPPFKFKLSHCLLPLVLRICFMICGELSNFVNCIRFSPDGSKLISISSDKKGIIYDAKTGETIGELSSEDGHTGSIYAVSWSADSKHVLAVSADKTAKIWEIFEDGNGKVEKMLDCPGYGEFLYISDCGVAEHIDIGSQLKDLSHAINSPDLALVSTDCGVVLLKGLQVLSNINLGFTVTASVIAPDGSNSLTEAATLEKHRGAISVIRYSPDVSMFASADLNREAVVWDHVSKEVKLNNMLYHTASINCLAWSPDSTMVAMGSLDTWVIIYEVGKPPSSRITIKNAHPCRVYGLVFTDDCSVVISGEDACICVWRIALQ
ncbi:hypothetical protein REPUB_Repub04eG0207400 [Reevesia pubescens]